jgi:hypothetical protein
MGTKDSDTMAKAVNVGPGPSSLATAGRGSSARWSGKWFADAKRSSDPEKGRNPAR